MRSVLRSKAVSYARHIYAESNVSCLAIVCIPIAVIWTNITPVLIALHQDPEIAKEAGLYTRLMIPGIFAFGLIQCLPRFLQAQNIVLPMLLCSGVTALQHAFMCWVLVHKFGLRIKGAVIENSISHWTNCLLLAFYVNFSSNCPKTFTGFSMEAFNKIFNLLRLARPLGTYGLDAARGCRWQKIGAYINLGSFCLVGIPSPFLLAFVFHFGEKGLWLGIICAFIIQIFTRWEEEVSNATERVCPCTVPTNTAS